MSVQTFPMGGDWSGELPQLAWVFEIGEQKGKALNIVYTGGAKHKGVIEMPKLLDTTPTGKTKFHKEANKNPEPTALSLRIDEDLYLGFRLAKSMDVDFAAIPFTGGDDKSVNAYFEVTRVTDRTAYMLVRGSQFPKGGCCYPFNIHLVAIGTFDDGVAYATPIILDPDGRYPDGSGPPG